jgi:hypothetical protein
MPRSASSIKMSLSNISLNHNYINLLNSNKQAMSNKSTTMPTLTRGTSLKSPMVSRINGVNASCGSCGRK